MGRATEKHWPKRPSDCQLQEARKKTLIGPYSWGRGSLCPCTLCTAGSLQAKQLPHLHAQLSLGQSCHRQKKKSCIYVCRVASVVSDSLGPCGLWLARLLCQGGVLQARTLECVGQYWLPYPSAAAAAKLLQLCPTLCNPIDGSSPGFPILLPWPSTPLSIWCCQNPCDPYTISIPGPHRGKPKSSRAPSGVNPSG